MILERFGFSSAHSATTPITACTSAATVVTKPSISSLPTLVSQSSRLTAPPMKRRRFSSNWSEGWGEKRHVHVSSGQVYCLHKTPVPPSTVAARSTMNDSQ